MRGLERAFVIWAIVYMGIYCPVFIACAMTDTVFPYLIPFHFLGMIQNLAALILTIRDLYLRPFPDANSKLTWGLLIVATGGIGWIVYVFRYALQPRPVHISGKLD